jgi:hypothetical protein
VVPVCLGVGPPDRPSDAQDSQREAIEPGIGGVRVVRHGVTDCRRKVDRIFAEAQRADDGILTVGIDMIGIGILEGFRDPLGEDLVFVDAEAHQRLTNRGVRALVGSDHKVPHFVPRGA